MCNYVKLCDMSATKYFDDVVSCGTELKYVPAEFVTKEICWTAVKQNGMSIEHVPQDMLTDDMILEAIKQCPKSAKHVIKLMTPELWMEAVTRDGTVIQFTPSKFRTDELLKHADQRYVDDPFLDSYASPEVIAFMDKSIEEHNREADYMKSRMVGNVY